MEAGTEVCVGGGRRSDRWRQRAVNPGCRQERSLVWGSVLGPGGGQRPGQAAGRGEVLDKVRGLRATAGYRRSPALCALGKSML